jgi:hypothetical protein
MVSSFVYLSIADHPKQLQMTRMRLIILAGIVAGTVATLAQLLLWWLNSVPLPDVLYRDTRLAAALVLPDGIIALDQLFQPPDLEIWLAASFIHFALSILYAGIFVSLSRHLAFGSVWLLPAGLGFGLALYVINMYGFTHVAPWFIFVRDWITITAHAVFGLSLALVVWANTRSIIPLLPI